MRGAIPSAAVVYHLAAAGTYHLAWEAMASVHSVANEDTGSDVESAVASSDAAVVALSPRDRARPYRRLHLRLRRRRLLPCS